MLLLLQLGIEAASAQFAEQRFDVTAGSAIENDYRAEQLHHGEKALVVHAGFDASVPMAAERQDGTVEVSGLVALLIVEGVVAANGEEVTTETVKDRAAFMHDEERKVFRLPGPFLVQP